MLRDHTRDDLAVLPHPRDGPSLAVEVEVFPLEVTFEKAAWPEMGERKRLWAGTREAAELVVEPDLRAAILSFAPA